MLEAQLTIGDLARIHEALGHAARIAMLRILRARRSLPLPRLRRELAEAGFDMDSRSLQFHLHKLERATVVDVRPGEDHDEAVLIRDVIVRTRIVQN